MKKADSSSMLFITGGVGELLACALLRNALLYMPCLLRGVGVKGPSMPALGLCIACR